MKRKSLVITENFRLQTRQMELHVAGIAALRFESSRGEAFWAVSALALLGVASQKVEGRAHDQISLCNFVCVVLPILLSRHEQ